mmetsp:Transcript_5192/g.12942  ORF Transcript_5192/g.12942 Transcript_5192/m.12942 type:complete len:291 (+) Transcript_5192:74-946(+)
MATFSLRADPGHPRMTPPSVHILQFRGTQQVKFRPAPPAASLNIAPLRAAGTSSNFALALTSPPVSQTRLRGGRPASAQLATGPSRLEPHLYVHPASAHGTPRHAGYSPRSAGYSPLSGGRATPDAAAPNHHLARHANFPQPIFRPPPSPARLPRAASTYPAGFGHGPGSARGSKRNLFFLPAEAALAIEARSIGRYTDSTWGRASAHTLSIGQRDAGVGAAGLGLSGSRCSLGSRPQTAAGRLSQIWSAASSLSQRHQLFATDAASLPLAFSQPYAATLAPSSRPSAAN